MEVRPLLGDENGAESETDFENNSNSEENDPILSSVFQKYESFIRYIAWMNAPEVSLVDDIVQEVFLTLIQAGNRWDLKQDPRPLLRTITRNIAIDHWRKSKRYKVEYLMELDEILRRETSQIETELEMSHGEEELKVLPLCMDKLTPRSRSLIERHYFQGELLKSLAAELKVGLQTLYRQFDQIRIALKKCIEATLGIEVSDD